MHLYINTFFTLSEYGYYAIRASGTDYIRIALVYDTSLVQIKLDPFLQGRALSSYLALSQWHHKHKYLCYHDDNSLGFGLVHDASPAV